MAAYLPLRILCLHDSHSNAEQLKTELDTLGKRLFEKHGGIDLVYVNSPIALQLETERVWWEAVKQRPALSPQQKQHQADLIFDSDNDDEEENDENGSMESSQDQELSLQAASEKEGTSAMSELAAPYYRGLDASLQLLRQVWMSQPFWGILGVGQGAAVSALLTLILQTSENPVPPPSFAIFVRGQTLLPEQECLIDHMPCLHILDTHDALHREGTLLSHQFPGTCASVLSPDQRMGKDAFNVMGRFILSQKKKAMGSGRDLVLLQNALYFTEQQAADKIALEIAKNPPAPLMAIIRPQHVAGWQGNKRRQPGEEGGGAPCPSEFLLKRDKRHNRHKTGGGGVSRVHPNQQAERDASSYSVETSTESYNVK
ncbi:hypothetical protein FisN_3Lh308 [Fistulifera solaris]|uniref:Serine hydrolase domain-containing protein n=1 Tax=Fistulifera solaris TaxID=1519565 RepID=A0A1Z5J7Z2_FISSO|nr:hypothetical protein FisN_3Lh308 [Fistulifera solaris]|eukprot:GAX10117.1 hypothetical protein FisN_3Lh308 [Fistulifera solaris]